MTQPLPQTTAPPTARTLLELREVWKSFPGVTALKGVSLSLAAGEVHAVLGENGAGKSTLMAVASGSIAPDAGAIHIGGESYPSLSPAEAQSHGVAIVHQHPAVLPDLTVAENLALAAGATPTAAWMREHPGDAATFPPSPGNSGSRLPDHRSSRPPCSIAATPIGRN